MRFKEMFALATGLALCGAAITPARAQSGPLQPPAGLVHWWPGETNALDITGSLPGSYDSVVTFPKAEVHYGFGFNGSDTYVAMPDDPSIELPVLTVDAWVKFNGLNSAVAATRGLQYLVFKQNSRTQQFEGYALLKTRTSQGDVFQFIVSSASGQQAVCQSTTLITKGVEYHVAGSYDGTTARLYVNGALESTAAAGFSLDYGPEPLFLGTSGETYHDGRMYGSLDELHIFDRALSDSEVASIYAAGHYGIARASITHLNPAYINAGGPNAILSVVGSNFTPNAVVEWNGAPLSTTYITSGKLSAVVPASDTASPGSAQVVVAVPGGGESQEVTLPIPYTTLTFTYVTAARDVSTISVYERVKNTGHNAADNFQITSATLAGEQTYQPLPVSVGTLAPGAETTITLVFDGTNLASGTKAKLVISGNFTGGTAASSQTITLP